MKLACQEKNEKSYSKITFCSNLSVSKRNQTHMNEDKKPELLTAEEVADQLKINKRSVALLVKKGFLKCLRPGERRTYFTQEMVNEYLGV